MCHQYTVPTNWIPGPICTTCNRVEHRALNLTTSSITFRTPTAHVIFVSLTGTPENSVCILCKLMVPSEAQESHLFGKRHARNMKRAHGPRACTCHTLDSVPMPVEEPKVLVAKSRSKIPDVTNERLNNLRQSNQRHKQKRCGQRSYIANVMKLGRAGLFSAHARVREYHTNSGKPPVLRVRKQPLGLPSLFIRRPVMLFNGIQITNSFLTALSASDLRGRVFWTNALHYIRGYIQRPPALLSYTPEPDSEDERASALAQIKQIYAVFLEAKEAGVDITGAEEPPRRSSRRSARARRLRKQQQQQQYWWRCHVCNRSMHSDAMETHLQGGPHARKLCLAAFSEAYEPCGRAVTVVR